MRGFISLISVMLVLICCQTKKEPVEVLQINDHPAWIMQGNIYEVNVRQYTPEGTFNAFAKHLDRLKEMGVQTLWFMPLNPISKKDRKGTLGSYYAVSSYTTINPEFGTMTDWKNLVNTIHEKGMKVIIDWVPNHTGADHPWLIRTGVIRNPIDDHFHSLFVNGVHQILPVGHGSKLRVDCCVA